MKVTELRAKLSKMKKEEIVRVASEFYKLIPKAKREDYDLEGLLANPTQPKKNSRSSAPDLIGMSEEIARFIEHAKAQYYLAPNRIVPKNKRSKWRFQVKGWYKTLTSLKGSAQELDTKANLLKDLYQLMCQACAYTYFSSYDPFRSIQVAQAEFYQSVLQLFSQAYGKSARLDQLIGLINEEGISRDALYSDMMQVFVAHLDIPDLKYRALDLTRDLLQALPSPGPEKATYAYFSSKEFQIKEKRNHLAELGFRLHAGLHEWEEAITFFQTFYNNRSEEVKLYVLVSLLQRFDQLSLVQQQMEQAIAKGIQPRNNLLQLLASIKRGSESPG